MAFFKARGKDGSFTGYWYEGTRRNGKGEEVPQQRSEPLYTSDEEIARDWVRRKEKELLCKKAGIPNDEMLIAEFIERYFYKLAESEDRRPATMDAYRHAFHTFAAKCPSVKTFRQATDDSMRDFIIRRKKDGVEAGTINSELQRLRSLFNYAVIKKIITESPLKHVKNLPQAEKPIQWFEIAEYKRYYEEAMKYEEKCWQDAIYIARCGLRPQEVYWLNWLYDLSDKNIESHIIMILPKYDWMSKTKKIRCFPIGDRTYRYIREAKQRSKSEWFIAYKNGERPTYQVFNAMLSRILKDAGIHDKTFRHLRKTAASQIGNSGEFQLQDVQRLLGHSSPEITQRHYNTIFPERFRKMGQYMDDEIGF